MRSRTSWHPHANVIVTRFGGIYQLKKLRDQGLKTKLIDAASDVGGTWYWYVAEALQRELESIPRY